MGFGVKGGKFIPAAMGTGSMVQVPKLPTDMKPAKPAARPNTVAAAKPALVSPSADGPSKAAGATPGASVPSPPAAATSPNTPSSQTEQKFWPYYAFINKRDPDLVRRWLHKDSSVEVGALGLGLDFVVIWVGVLLSEEAYADKTKAAVGPQHLAMVRYCGAPFGGSKPRERGGYSGGLITDQVLTGVLVGNSVEEARFVNATNAVAKKLAPTNTPDGERFAFKPALPLVNEWSGTIHCRITQREMVFNKIPFIPKSVFDSKGRVAPARAAAAEAKAAAPKPKNSAASRRRKHFSDDYSDESGEGMLDDEAGDSEGGSSEGSGDDDIEDSEDRDFINDDDDDGSAPDGDFQDKPSDGDDSGSDDEDGSDESEDEREKQKQKAIDAALRSADAERRKKSRAHTLFSSDDEDETPAVPVVLKPAQDDEVQLVFAGPPSTVDPPAEQPKRKRRRRTAAAAPAAQTAGNDDPPPPYQAVDLAAQISPAALLDMSQKTASASGDSGAAPMDEGVLAPEHEAPAAPHRRKRKHSETTAAASSVAEIPAPVPEPALAPAPEEQAQAETATGEQPKKRRKRTKHSDVATGEPQPAGPAETAPGAGAPSADAVPAPPAETLSDRALVTEPFCGRHRANLFDIYNAAFYLCCKNQAERNQPLSLAPLELLGTSTMSTEDIVTAVLDFNSIQEKLKAERGEKVMRFISIIRQDISTMMRLRSMFGDRIPTLWSDSIMAPVWDKIQGLTVAAFSK